MPRCVDSSCTFSLLHVLFQRIDQPFSQNRRTSCCRPMQKECIQATPLLPQALMMHGARTNTISGDDLVFGFMPVWTRS